MLCYVGPCYVCCVVLCCVMLYLVILNYFILCYDRLGCVVLRCFIVCYVVCFCVASVTVSLTWKPLQSVVATHLPVLLRPRAHNGCHTIHVFPLQSRYIPKISQSRPKRSRTEAKVCPKATQGETKHAPQRPYHTPRPPWYRFMFWTPTGTQHIKRIIQKTTMCHHLSPGSILVGPPAWLNL